MHPNLGRDIPLFLGTVAVLIGIFRAGTATTCKNPDEPQWMCHVVFYFVGMLLIGFGVLGHYSPH